MASKTVYVCSECGYKSMKWLGKCPNCSSWNTLSEEEIEDTVSESKNSMRKSMLTRAGSEVEAIALSENDLPDYLRAKTGCAEFDRVLGGGLVNGSVVLISGEPGIGKSTLLLQICSSYNAEGNILYVSGEESAAQISLRAKRLGIKGQDIYVLSETNTPKILEKAKSLSPKLLIVDSIQTMYHTESNTIPGSVTQIRECASMYINFAKTSGVPVILVGHVTKEGSIAGPKVLEHMVDTVLYFEGDRSQGFRLIRAMKNRFGPTNEIGVFEMTDSGLKEMPNPSSLLLSDRPGNVSGNCAIAIIEGTRPLIAEIQALVTPTIFPSPKRMSTGTDYNRLALILAVLEKRLGLRFSINDVYLNVVGGIRIEETASDTGTALALISSIRDIPVPEDLVCMGELGLSGEIRAVSRAEDRVAEAKRLGFKKVVLPKRNIKLLHKVPEGIELIPVANIFELLKLFAPNGGEKC